MITKFIKRILRRDPMDRHTQANHTGLPAAHAQNLQKLYDLSVEDKKRLDQEEKDKKSKTENFYTEAKANGQYWKCDKNLFIFYRGYVVTGAKDDGSDMGKSPYDLIGNYQVVNNQFIHFSFPTLPYDNIFELNIAKGEAVVFKSNRLHQTSSPGHADSKTRWKMEWKPPH